MRYPDDFLLISKAAVERFHSASPGFRQFLARFLVPGGPVRRFSNGAIEIHETGVDGADEHPLYPYASPGCEMEGRGSFRTLGPFVPKRFYCVQYPADYQDRLKSEVSFHTGEGVRVPSVPGEFDLENLRVTAVFRTRVGRDVRRAFTEAVAEWGQAASQRGAFEDGPARLVSPGVTFTGTRAQFQIDVTRSGQDTLNWLSLVILDFGYELQPITFVKFGYTDAELDTVFGTAKDKPVMVNFPGVSRAATSHPGDQEPPVSYVPAPAVPSTSFRSKSFRVLTLPFDEWDSFVATVYFGRGLQADDRQHFVALVEAWRRLGSYGGFGGVGTHSADEVQFDEATDSAIIRADMGDANPAIALAVLIRALEGFESGFGTPIEAVVFGTSG